MPPPSSASPAIILLATLLGGTGVSPASPSTETSAYVGANTTNDYKTSSTGAPLTSSRSRPGSTITTHATPGLMTVNASAASSIDTSGIAQGNAAAQDTYTITGGSGPGIATFTYDLSGSMAASRTYRTLANYFVSFDSNLSISGRIDENGVTGIMPPQTLLVTKNFTYGAPFDLHASLVVGLDMGYGSSGTADLTLRCAGYSVNGASNYTGSSSAGTTRGTLLAPGAAYDGITLANTRNLQSTVTLRDGNAGAQRNLALNFMAPLPGLPALSDIVDIKGTGTDLIVIELSYDRAAALLAGDGVANVILSWFDTAAQLWKPAVEGNAGGTASFKNGPYVAPDDLVLGRWGIDRARNVVWAVVNHNSQFAAMPGQLPAPPTNYAAWKSQNFTEAERANDTISGPEADPDADGLSNFQEYAFFIDPRRASSNPATGSITGTGDFLTYHTMTYLRRKGATDLSFIPQFGSDLANWTTGANVSTTDHLDGSETVVDRDNTPTRDLSGRRFARVRVTP